MHFTTEQITGWIGSYLWVLVRVAAMIMAAPAFGSRSVPVRARLVLVLALTIVITPTLPPAPLVEPLSADAFLITLHQVLIGIIMGLSFQLIFNMFVVGGQIIAYQMGLGFAQMVDPQSGTQVPVISQFYVILVTLLFFSLEGHLALIKVLVESFQRLPIGPHGVLPAGYWQLIEWSKHMFIGGVKIALPAIAAIFLVNFTFGVVTRSAPQFNIFSIGFPLSIAMGFFVLLATSTTVLPHLIEQLSNAISVTRALLQVN